MMDVHNELKGYVVTASLWIGNGGLASNTSMGGATVEFVDGPRLGWSHNAIYINFNDEEDYELGESSLGGKHIASIDLNRWD